MQFNPKFKHVELHSHLDGSFQAETLFKIANRRSIKIPFENSQQLKDFLQIKKNTDLRTFLKKFETVLPIVAGNKEALADVCDDYIRMCAESHICYIETRFAPIILTGPGCDEDSVVVTMLDALHRSGEKYGVIARVLLSAMRHLDQHYPSVLDLARKYRTHGVVGIDLAGDELMSFENKGTSQVIIDMFEQAHREGIHRTVHAGENGPVDMIEEAINKMHAERIGHGYHVLENAEIYQKLRNKNVHFEICPSSSYLTGAVTGDHIDHPIHTFMKDKVNFSISCDDSMITGRNLAEEYDFCRQKFNVSEAEIKRCNINAAEACFLDGNEKEMLLEHLMEQS